MPECRIPDTDSGPFCPARLILARGTDHEWVRHGATLLEQDRQRTADTHLVRVELPGLNGIQVYLTDASPHPTGGG